MGKAKPLNRKIRLLKENRHTKYAPIWAVIKRYGRFSPLLRMLMTRKKRHWRRDSTWIH